MGAVSHLKLVHVKPSKPGSKYSPRPIKIQYEGGGTGHCRTLRNALCAATRHIILGGLRKCTIFSDGIMVADVEQRGYQVLVKWRRGTIDI
jgi:hypothetical protein